MAAVDTAIATVILAVLFLAYGDSPEPEIIGWFPVLLAIQVAFTLGATMLISAIVVYFRDLRQVLPMALQMGLLATPIAWPLADVPGRYQWVYAVINPLGPVIDGYRSAALYGEAPDGGLLAVAAVSATCFLVGGYLLFKRLETGFADVA
jgi:ABC-2 type transport system permease protein/lipopolysaccharide transport system permease protein